MRIIRFVLFLVLVLVANSESFKISEKALCLACKVVANKIATAIEEDTSLRQVNESETSEYFESARTHNSQQ